MWHLKCYGVMYQYKEILLDNMAPKILWCDVRELSDCI